MFLRGMVGDTESGIRSGELPKWVKKVSTMIFWNFITPAQILNSYGKIVVI